MKVAATEAAKKNPGQPGVSGTSQPAVKGVELADFIGGSILGWLAYPCDKKVPYYRQHDWAKKKSDNAVS